MNRKQWWLRLILPILVITLVLAFVDRVIGTYDPNSGGGILIGLFALISLIPAILVHIKRWHDRDKSGWWMLIALVPIIGSIWFLIELGFLAGTLDRIGSAPRQRMRDLNSERVSPNSFSCQVRLALFGHPTCTDECPLSRVKRT